MGVPLTTGELWSAVLLSPFDRVEVEVHPFICSHLIIDNIIWVCSSFLFRCRTLSTEMAVEKM